MVGGEAGVPGRQHSAHHFDLGELREFLVGITRPLARFLVVWLISYTAMNGVAVLFPVVMAHQYAMPPSCQRAPTRSGWRQAFCSTAE
jgi:hypothetical protein